MSTGESLRSKRYDLADAFAANELYQAKGWTDGLPIVPPTEERVSECLDAAGLAPGGVVGGGSVRRRTIMAGEGGPNAVLAGGLLPPIPAVCFVCCGVG